MPDAFSLSRLFRRGGAPAESSYAGFHFDVAAVTPQRRIPKRTSAIPDSGPHPLTQNLAPYSSFMKVIEASFGSASLHSTSIHFIIPAMAGQDACPGSFSAAYS